MAAKRIAKSAINWSAFAERVPEDQKHFYQLFKAKSDGYLRRVFSFPENPPAIDFGMYKSRLANVALVDQFEKSYKSFTVPFPKEHLTPQIDAEERAAKEEVQGFIQESKDRIAQYKQELAKFEAMVPAAHMTMEDFHDYFPDHAINVDKPTFWPHDGSVDSTEEDEKESH